MTDTPIDEIRDALDRERAINAVLVEALEIAAGCGNCGACRAGTRNALARAKEMREG